MPTHPITIGESMGYQWALSDAPLALILSETGAHAFFQTVNITVVLMIVGDRVIQRVLRGLIWLTNCLTIALMIHP